MASIYPASLRAINDLPKADKRRIYGTLIPDWVLTTLQIDRSTFYQCGHKSIKIRCTPGTRVLEMIVKRHPHEQDPMLYLHMTDTLEQQILVLLVVVNDMDAPRYNIDIDQNGNPTRFGTVSRNIPAEIEAMKAGLAPGQVRRGLRAFRSLTPIFETFITDMGHDIFFIEPLAYHNAIVFERYGFNYLRGLKDMREIHGLFQPVGAYHERLDIENPFRQPEYWLSVRGRSWAIHDGILGHPFTGFQMYKRIGHDAGVNSFPGYEW